MFRWFYLALFIGLAPLPAGADVKSVVLKDGREVILLQNEILAGDSDQMKTLLQAAQTAGRAVSGVHLDSKGGGLREGIRLAAIVREARLRTVVGDGRRCASACFIVFSAGAEKYAGRGARIGVHGASDKDGKETMGSNAATIGMARTVKELGVPPAIIGKMVVTPPSQMVWLTEDELRSMGVRIMGGAARAEPSPGPASPAVAGRPSWDEVTAAATTLSATQNNGKAEVSRICQPEIKTCNIAVFYKNEAGKRVMVRRSENVKGETISRDICEFNPHRDIRTCTNWGATASTTEMKDAAGKWRRVE